MQGGSEVTSPAAFPFAVFLLTFQPEVNNFDAGKVRICTGSLITPRWVLSAAHCFIGPLGRGGRTLQTLPPHLTEIRAHFLNNNRSSGGYYYTSRARRIVIHPDYIYKIRNDLSLVLSLHSFPTLPELHPISLANVTFTKFYETVRERGRQPSCTIVGYGEKYPRDPMSYVALHTMRIAALPAYRCPFRLIFLILKTDPICFVSQYGSGPCMGDSGGPLICDNQLTGILSRGIFHEQTPSDGQGDLQPLVIYEDLTHFRPWILAYIAQDEATDQKAQRVNVTCVKADAFSLEARSRMGNTAADDRCSGVWTMLVSLTVQWIVASV